MTESFESVFYRPCVFREVARVAWPPSWLGHTPFALWLMDELRPATVVELGTHTGNSFSAFCQGAVASGYNPACYAVDTWKGDPHAGVYGEEIYEELNAYISKSYGGFAQLVRATFNDALSQFGDGTVDLLNIDGYHTYEATRENFVNWLPKMSARGVVLLHDTNVHSGDFGAWKLWDELKDSYPSFSFLHSHGLGVLVVGSEITPGLRWLTDRVRSATEITAIRNLFTSLGAAPTLRSTNEQLSSKVNALQLELEKPADVAPDSREFKLEQELKTERATRNALELNLRQQAAKISNLLAQLESQGSLYAKADEWRALGQARLGPTIDKASQRLSELESALPWQSLGQGRLGETIDRASHQIDVLHSHVVALCSPGHRAVSYMGRCLGHSRLGRALRKALHMVVAVRHA